MKSVFTKQELTQEIKEAKNYLKNYSYKYYEVQQLLFFYKSELEAIERGEKQERE